MNFFRGEAAQKISLQNNKEKQALPRHEGKLRN